MTEGFRPGLRDIVPDADRRHYAEEHANEHGSGWMSQHDGARSARPVPGPTAGDAERRYTDEPSPRRVRVMLGGQFVADSTRVRLLFETGRLPVYYFPKSDVRLDLFSETGSAGHDPVKGRTRRFDVRIGERVAREAAWSCEGRAGSGPDISDLVAFEWNEMDAWFEEDEEVFVHARDPYHRVDVLESSRHVVVRIDGVTVADTRRPMMLFETGLPTRYYVAKMDVRLALLERSRSHTACPYKGTADYFHVRTERRLVEDIAWCYEAPIPEMPKIAGRISFFNEKVDIEIDDEREERPLTKWS